ncbi:MAG: hypothetical protein PHW13_11455 [Methylococcales bacterium]|nr:hypothetical protein [Methylococcales bacterium]
MSEPKLMDVANLLNRAGSTVSPTAILAREIPIYEIEFSELEFAEETKLPSSDWAVLALARALGQISPNDVDAYLGLGETVSDGLVHRLLGSSLLDAPGNEETTPKLTGWGWLTRWASESDAHANRKPTQASKLNESSAAATPKCHLSVAGSQALERGVVMQRRVRSARLLFIAEPLLFIGIADEKKQTYATYQRKRPLEPGDVPKSLHILDAVLALRPDERLGACGIEANIQGISGQFVEIVPGSQWEVRPSEQRIGKQTVQKTALLALAALPTSRENVLDWKIYLGLPDGKRPRVLAADVSRFFHDDLGSISSFLGTLEPCSMLPTQRDLREDGAFDIRCDTDALRMLMGETAEPSDTSLPVKMGRWHGWLRIHAAPSNSEAGREAFYAFLQRQDAKLRQDFDRTCADVANSLNAYWGLKLKLPSADEASIKLWEHAALRAALCRRRLHDDLVVPYESAEVAQ